MAPARRARVAPAASSHGPSKLQRWLDVLAALLARRYPIALEQLRADVPAYQTTRNEGALNRMFERDKDEMRAFGIPIETVQAGDPLESGYQLRTADFYLPFLELASRGKSAQPARSRRGVYASLKSLTFEPDELELIARAATRVQALGDPMLADDAASAMRKLAFELPVDAMGHAAAQSERVVTDDGPGHRATFAQLGQALLARKRVTFTYHAIGSDTTTTREVEPYGLVFLGSHWYLVAPEAGHEELRNFRLSRMSNVSVNRARMRAPDYAIPAGFRLQEHARSRQAWELGDQDVEEVLVEVRVMTGATKAAATLGEEVRGAPSQRRFRVRRADAFARWLLAFAGDVVPVAPPAMVQRFRALARDTLRVYEGGV